MKAQITVEYLMLLLVFMAVLSIVLATLYSVKESSENALEILSFDSQIELIDSRINEVCSLGSGNSREIDIIYPMNISYYEEGIQFSYENHSISKSYPCKIQGENSFADKIIIKNEQGTVILHK